MPDDLKLIELYAECGCPVLGAMIGAVDRKARTDILPERDIRRQGIGRNTLKDEVRDFGFPIHEGGVPPGE